MIGTCEDCEQECSVGIVDFGIGHYEFWGAPGFDSQPEAVSDCCEAPAFNDQMEYISQEDIKEEEECARADYYIDLQKDRQMFPDDYDYDCD